MLIYPAVDLMGGSCVRLSQGLFDSAKVYSGDPKEALDGFAEAGALWTHVVDLDGARAREPRQHNLIAHLAGDSRQQLQVAGGFRTREQVARMLDVGVGRVVIGSLAVTAPETVGAWIDEFGTNRITLAFDIRLADGVPEIATAGWTEASGRSLWDVAALYPQATHVLVTDISRDGMMAGPNVDLIAETVRLFPHLQVQASGGVASLEDLRSLNAAGGHGAIVGKALWEGKLDLREAIDAVG